MCVYKFVLCAKFFQKSRMILIIRLRIYINDDKLVRFSISSSSRTIMVLLNVDKIQG